MASTAVYWHFYYSQIQLLLAAAVLDAYFLLRRGWSLSPAVLFLGAGLLKLYPLVLLPWFLWRGAGSPGARARRVAVVAGLALLLVGITGLDLWRGFLAGAVRGPSYHRRGWADSRTRLFSGRLRAPSVAR